MAIYYLLLGHLLGDFVLQTNVIADNKGRYWKWTLLHVFLVTLCIFAMAVPFGEFTLVLVIFNGIIHFFMDYYKPKLAKLFKMSDLTGFLADQLLHIFLLYMISLTAVPDRNSYMLRDPQTIKLLLVIILVTYFAAVLNQFLLGAAFPRAESRFFEQGEKQIGIILRLFITSILYFSIVVSPMFLLLLILAASALVLVYMRIWSSWMSNRQLVFKIFLDLAVSMAGICLIFWI